MAGPSEPTDRRQARVPFWRDVRVLSVLTQVIVLLVVLGVGGFLLSNLLSAMDQRGLSPSFDFLPSRAGFEIGQKVIPYTPDDPYARALLVGLLNTLMVSIVALVFATILGLLVGIARLSRNWLVNRIALGYVELFRNTPLLVQLFIILFVVFLQFPPVREAIVLPGSIYLTQRGLYMPRPELASEGAAWLLIVAIAVIGAGAIWLLAGRRESVGRPIRGVRWVAAAILFGLPIVGWVVIADPVTFEVPELGGFNFNGGLRFTSQFAALALGLTLYHAAFIAELVRGGITSVNKGQLEAARAIGLNEGQILRLVVLPQALRVIVPPLTSEYLNLIKNSSLAIVIGFADLFNVSRTIAEQTGQPVAVIVLVMAFYLGVSLITSTIMNLYNRRVQLADR